MGDLAATVAVAGALHFSGPDTPDAPAGAVGQEQAAAPRPDEILAKLEKAKLTPAQAYRIALLTDAAPLDPFYGGQDSLSQDEAEAGGGTEFVYSGYIKIGQKLLAVINGVEYAQGDELAEGGYRVQAIDKASVLLERTDGSSGRKFTRRVPLVEDDTTRSAYGGQKTMKRTPPHASGCRSASLPAAGRLRRGCAAKAQPKPPTWRTCRDLEGHGKQSGHPRADTSP